MEDNKPVTSMRVAELVMAGIFLAFGALVMWDSRRLGSQWGADGPQAGYFPFYIGLAIVISAAAIIFRALNLGERGRAAFVEWGQLRMILTVMIPTVIYVGLIANPWFGLGIYVASAAFIAFFMWHLGKYRWARIVPVSLGVMFFFFLMFEVWFKVPLPKGPLEAAFGFG
jgi:putative tricarboxylic transport membrane protein